jgi:glycosyltransferase involved in cell wall biosynthesis
LIKDGDSVAFMEAIAYLIENPSEREKMGCAARKHVLKHFELDNARKELMGMYRELS